MEAHAIHGAERCANLVKADQDLELGLKADAEFDARETVRGASSSTAENRNAGQCEVAENACPCSSKSDTQKNGKAHARRRAVNTASLRTIKVLRLAFAAPLAARARVSHIAPLAVCLRCRRIAQAD